MSTPALIDAGQGDGEHQPASGPRAHIFDPLVMTATEVLARGQRKSPERVIVEHALMILRADRDRVDWGTDRELRQAYNAACDRLDVLANKLCKREKR